MKAKELILGLVALSVILFGTSASAGVPQMINYQAVLTDTNGCPVGDDDYTIIFLIYDASSGGNLLWSETHDAVSTVQGNLNVLLGITTPIPDSVFVGDSVWLAVKVGNDAEMTPRQRIASVGYAFQSEYSDTADYARAGGAPDNDWTFRITDTADTTLVTGGAWGIARYGNVLYGSDDSTHVNLGVACTTGTTQKEIRYRYCTVGGGKGNTASYTSATVGGGQGNTASGFATTLGGGEGNTASGYAATVAGGRANTASGTDATIGGGESGSASDDGATVAGGHQNIASGVYAAVGGGWVNTASANYATVGGGGYNTASGLLAAVPGGHANTASGNYAFAAGRRAKANHDGSFVWADTTDEDFASTGDNQFLIRASGGVGIGATDPSYDLDVNEDVRVRDDLTVNDRVNIVDPLDPIIGGLRLQVNGDARIGDNLTVGDDLSVGGTIKLTFDYDTTVQISEGSYVTLTHNLGGDSTKYIVSLYGRSTSGYVHQKNYGTNYIVGGWRGCEWGRLTSTSIRVWRGDNDASMANDADWKYVNVRILKNQ